MKHLIKIESAEHGVLGVRHAGLDQQYANAGDTIILEWQPDAKWGLEEAHYTDTDGNVTPIDLTTIRVDGKDVVVFTMPDSEIIVGGTFKRFVIHDWTPDVRIEVVDASTIPDAMDADKVYRYGTLEGDTTFPEFNTPDDDTVAHVYCWTFSTPNPAPTITWPAAITMWAGGSAPTINASNYYEVSVMDGLATIIEA